GITGRSWPPRGQTRARDGRAHQVPSSAREDLVGVCLARIALFDPPLKLAFGPLRARVGAQSRGNGPPVRTSSGVPSWRGGAPVSGGGGGMVGVPTLNPDAPPETRNVMSSPGATASGSISSFGTAITWPATLYAC